MESENKEATADAVVSDENVQKQATPSNQVDGDVPATSARRMDEQGDQDRFGWQPCTDPITNGVYFVHTHTGEVRRPTATNHRRRESMPYNDQTPSPFCSPLVMLPMGITPTQPAAFSFESWSGGYQRFPLYQSSRGMFLGANMQQSQTNMTQGLHNGRRMLPCTWELSRHGPPFLAAFPVVVVQPEWIHVPEEPAMYLNPLQAGIWAAPTPCYEPPATAVRVPLDHKNEQLPLPPPCSDASTQVPVGCSGYNYTSENDESISPPPVVYKEHNRRGYGIRQARKLMKELGIAPSKNRNPPAATTTTKLQPFGTHAQLMRRESKPSRQTAPKPHEFQLLNTVHPTLAAVRAN